MKKKKHRDVHARTHLHTHTGIHMLAAVGSPSHGTPTGELGSVEPDLNANAVYLTRASQMPDCCLESEMDDAGSGV